MVKSVHDRVTWDGNLSPVSREGRVGRGTRERSSLIVGSWEVSKCGWRSNISPTKSRVVRRGFDFAVHGKNVLMGDIGKDPPRLPAEVEYLEFGMKEDKSTLPRSVEESKNQPNSVRLLSGLLKPRGGAKLSVQG